MCFRGNHILFFRVKHHDICIAAFCDHTFIGIHAIQLCRIFAEKLAHFLHRDPAGAHAISIQKSSSCLNPGKASWNLGEIFFSHCFLRQGKAALVSCNRLDLALCKCLPQAVLVLFLTDRRCAHILGAFEIRFGIHTVIQYQILGTGFCKDSLSVFSCAKDFLISLAVGKMNYHYRCFCLLCDHQKSVDSLSLHSVWAHQRMIFRT